MPIMPTMFHGCIHSKDQDSDSDMDEGGLRVGSPVHALVGSTLKAKRVAVKPEVPVFLSFTPSMSGSTTDIGAFPSATHKPGVSRSRTFLEKLVFMQGKVSLTLHGQPHGVSMPTYKRGGTVEGFVSIPSTVVTTRVEAKLEGFVTIREVAGGGNCRTTVLSETLVFWDENGRSCSPILPFKMLLPSHYTDDIGERTLLPPTFSERLPCVPGFNCCIEYAITLTVLHARDPSTLWRKRTVLRTPIEYRPRTRPSYPSPIPASSSRCRSRPPTLFKSVIEANSPHVLPMHTYLYLPNSQICSMSSSIPFYLKLSGLAAAVKLFAPIVPAPLSFHPLASPSPDSSSGLLSGGLNTLPQHFGLSSSSSSDPKPTLRVSLVRQVSVDAHNINPSDCILGCSASIYKNTVIGEGILLRMTQDEGSITWRGEIRMRADVRNGGFQTQNLVVRDAVMISINPTESSALSDFRQVVPIRLTTDSYDFPSAVKVSDL